MAPYDHQRGLTLVETLLASSLLFTLAGGLAGLILSTRLLVSRADQMTVAIVAAAARLERLRAVPWRYGPDGSAPDVPAMALSPPDALERNVEGFYEWLDHGGRAVSGLAQGPRLVSRWAVVAGPGDSTRGLEACVLIWPAPESASPLVCLTSAIGRQP